MQKKKTKEVPSDALARLKRTEVSHWSVEDVGIWLDFVQMSEYRGDFLKQAVSGAELFELDMDDLHELGITQLGHKKRLLKRIQMLKHGLEGAFRASSIASSEDSSSASSVGSSASSAMRKGAAGRDREKDKPEKVVFKCVCGDDISVIHMPADATLVQLKRRLRKEYGAKMMIRYQDSDGDKIRIKRNSHLREAISSSEGSVRLYLTERKRKVSTREQSVLDTMIDGIVSINSKGKILFFNKAAETMFGYGRNEVLRKNVNVLMPPAIAAKHDEYLQTYEKTRVAHIIGTGRTVNAKHKDGSTFPVRLSVTESVQNGEVSYTGTLTKVAAMPSNASSAESSSAQQSSAVTDQNSSSTGEAQRVMFSLLDRLLDACVVMNEKAIVQFWNASAEKKFGWKATEIIGKNVKVMMPAAIGDLHDSYVQRYLETRQANIIGIGREVIAQAKDGSMIPVHLSVTEQQLDGGKRLFTGVLRDVQEEYERAKTVLQQEREVLDNLCVPAIIIDQTGKIHAFNEAASKLLGYTLIEVVSRNVSMLMNSADASKHNSYITNYLQTGNAKMIGTGREVIAMHKNGSMIPVKLSVTEKRDGDKYIFTGILQQK